MPEIAQDIKILCPFPSRTKTTKKVIGGLVATFELCTPKSRFDPLGFLKDALFLYHLK